MTEHRMPTRLESSIKFFGRFTPSDLVRLLLPVLAASAYNGFQFSLEALPGLLTAATVGTLWYGVRLHGKPVDTHLYNLARYLALRGDVESTVVEDVDRDCLELGNGTKLAILKVSPTNLSMKTGDERQAVHSIYQDLFHSINYPVEIHSTQSQLNLDEYIEYIDDQASTDSILKADYLETCRELSEASLTTTHHYIVLRVSLSTLNQTADLLPNHLRGLFERFGFEFEQEAEKTELDSRCREIIDVLENGDLGVERLTGRNLDRFKNRFDHIPANPGARYTDRPGENGGEYRRTLYITEFPSSINTGWTIQLLQLDATVDITQYVEPRNTTETTASLRRLDERLNAEIDSLIHQGYRGTNRLETRLEDTEWFLQLLADREDEPVEYTVAVTVRSPDKDVCDRSFEKLRNRLQTMRINFEQPVLRADEALETTSPLRHPRLDESLLMPAGSAATGFPFGTRTIEQNQGVLYGTDTSDGTPILLDRFQWSSHSMARMGMVGSGKSYAAKIELLRSYLAYDDLQIYVVDPKQEYTRLIQDLDGKTYTLGEDPQLGFKTSDVISYQVNERGQEENVDRLVDTVRQIYDFASRDTRKTLVVIDEARILMNDENGRRVLNQFVLEGRDTNTAITLISQNASHFTFCREGREILDNMPGKVFMRHDRVPDSVVDYFDLSQQEKQSLFELKTGTDSQYSEALLKVSGRLDTKLRIDSTPQENALIETDARSRGD